MSANLSIVVRPALSKSSSVASRLVGACRDGIVGYFVRRAAIKTLRELDDRALRDIGLVRAQIEAAVHGDITLPGQART